ncbi:hypothetical protein SAMN05444413_10993 [Roseivivax marinus]|uniref:TadE/TadG family type IV pilus assembly protein n=1 Tax=Roseivivax marinus TaxID=1379903 RepID=UPI0008C6D747|nr:hypothetical protein [Roseivivax marinus]SEL45727.1 hypothetical protein SAMN05444413_10993 [Roseivivax marinus]
MKNWINTRLARFHRGEDGSINIEVMLALPFILWLMGAFWVWHDVTRQSNQEQRINYTVGDMISRETDPLDDAYIDATYELVLAMLDSEPAKTDMRISVVKQTKSWPNQEMNYQVVWSESRGARAPIDGNVTNKADMLPVMARNDQVILVETWTDYTPAFEAGLDAFEITSYSFTRPRFAPQVLFDAGSNSNSNQNNGWGNGDQDAPGNSLCNNNAENYDEGQASDECAANVDGGENVEPKRGRRNGHS